VGNNLLRFVGNSVLRFVGYMIGKDCIRTQLHQRQTYTCKQLHNIYT